MKKIITIIAAALALASCTQNIEKQLAGLESRVQALETQVAALNQNIEALQKLLSATTISSVSEKDNVYTIVLSNGQTLTLNQGSIGVANAPVMSVDAEGYWMVNYGNGPEYLLYNGQKVKAVGVDGLTPQMSVDAEGYWTVSYDGGVTSTRVLDANGNPVKAVADGTVTDVFFSNVVYNEQDGVLVVTLKDGGREIVIPVVKDFYCEIKDASGIQTFSYGQSKPYTVELRGVATTVVSAPQGWKAVLAENTLTVTSPSAPTKATLADSSKDVSILAVSAGGYTTISKIQVQLDGAPVVVTPSASVSLSTATETSLSFTVTTSDVTSWKYQLLSAGVEAPSVVDLATNGTDGQSAELTFNELASNSSYVLYVLPINGKTYGEIASLEAKTLAKQITSLYEEFVTEGKIIIAGHELTKETFGDATLVEADQDIAVGTGIFFVKEGVTVTYTGTGAVARLAIIGDKPASRSSLKVSAQLKLNQGEGRTDGTLVWANLHVDATPFNGNTLTGNRDGQFGLFAIVNCDVKSLAGKPLYYMATADRSFAEVHFEDSEFPVESSKGQFFNYGNTNATSIARITLRNNIIYCPSGVPTASTFMIVSLQGGTVGKLVVENNTFVNAWGSTNFLFFIGGLSELVCRGNIIFTDQAVTNNSGIFRTNRRTQEPYEGNPVKGYVGSNIGYAGTSGKSVQIIWGGMSATRVNPEGFEKLEECQALTDNPFDGGTFNLATGTFVPSSAYSDFGARR